MNEAQNSVAEQELETILALHHPVSMQKKITNVLGALGLAALTAWFAIEYTDRLVWNEIKRDLPLPPPVIVNDTLTCRAHILVGNSYMLGPPYDNDYPHPRQAPFQFNGYVCTPRRQP